VLRWKQRRMSAVAFGREPATQTNAKTQSARSSPHQVRLLRAAEARADDSLRVHPQTAKTPSIVGERLAATGAGVAYRLRTSLYRIAARRTTAQRLYGSDWSSAPSSSPPPRRQWR
jgi:hypothetical protein